MCVLCDRNIHLLAVGIAWFPNLCSAITESHPPIHRITFFRFMRISWTYLLGTWVWESELIIRWVNWLTQINPYNHIVHVKSTLQLISFGFSDRSVRSLVSANPSASCWAILKSRRKNDFHFWLIFGFSLNLGRSESLNERLIQKVKWPNVNAKNRCILV